MLEEIKEKQKATLIFQFLEKTERPTFVEILEYKNEIQDNTKELSFNISDLSINEYKVYECTLVFKNDKKSYSISIYYNRINYYLCGEGNQSIEIIFCDFIYKEIKLDSCYIKYKNTKYYPKENFGLLTRKRINLIGVDLNDLELPDDLEGKPLKFGPQFNKDLLITISVSDKRKVIGIYNNTPFIEPKLVIEQKLVDELKNKIESVSKILNFDDKKNFFDYQEGINEKNLEIYKSEIKSSFDYEKQISQYFSFYKEKLSDLEIQLYDLYSEYMLLFPDFNKVERNSDKIILDQYKNQYYYSKLAISNFIATMPDNLEESQKIKLKYAACRCLRSLLFNGYGSFINELFYFIDYSVEGTIYHDANEFNKKFVELLNEKSELFLFFLQLNSGSGINLLTQKKTARLSMLDENIVKFHLKSSIPKYGIRINCNSFFNACTINEVRISCICETVAFHQYLGDKIKTTDDPLYNRRYILANILQHEDFGHIKLSINFYSFYDINEKTENRYDPNSPINFYNAKLKEGMVEITKEEEKNNTIIISGESGMALESFLTRGNLFLMALLFDPYTNFQDLFEDPSLRASEDLSEFIKKLSSKKHPISFTPPGNLKIKFGQVYKAKGISLGFPTTEKF